MDVDQYGGWLDIERHASGWFRVEQVGSRWLFVTPRGHGYIPLGVNHIEDFLDKYVADPFKARHNNDRRACEQAMLGLIRGMGLNAAGAYPPYNKFLTRQLPYIPHIDYPEYRALDLFDPEDLSALRKHIAAACQPYIDDPFVIGYAFADRPDWGKVGAMLGKVGAMLRI